VPRSPVGLTTNRLDYPGVRPRQRCCREYAGNSDAWRFVLSTCPHRANSFIVKRCSIDFPSYHDTSARCFPCRGCLAPHYADASACAQSYVNTSAYCLACVYAVTHSNAYHDPNSLTHTYANTDTATYPRPNSHSPAHSYPNTSPYPSPTPFQYLGEELLSSASSLMEQSHALKPTSMSRLATLAMQQ
jgi:hypothetical protein